MTDSTFSPEVFTRPAPGFTLNAPFAQGTYEGKRYRVMMYPALLEYLTIENGPYEPMCSIASSDPLHGWEDTVDDTQAVTLLRKLIKERGLQFALRFARVFIDAEAVAVVTDETYAWGYVECIGFGAKDERMNVRGVLDWLELVGGCWVDVVLEVEEPSYDGQGSEWVSVDYTSLPNSESHEGDDALKHAMENFEWDVARLGDEFELELVSEQVTDSEQVAGSGQAVAA